MTGGGAVDVEELMLGHALQRVAWLSEEVLLLTCSPDAALVPPGASAGRGRQPSPPSTTIPARAFIAPLGTIFATAPPAGSLDRGGRIAFVDESSAEALIVEAEAVTAALTDLRTLLRLGAAGWDAATRTALLSFLAALGATHGLSLSLSEGLASACEALRERQPVTIQDRRAERGVVVERLHRIDEATFYIRGRAWDAAGEITRLSATSPEGERVELLDAVARDVPSEGDFAGLFPTVAPTRRRDGWVVEAASGSDRAVECPAHLAPDALSGVLSDASPDLAGAEALLEDHVLPAVARLNELRRSSVAVDDVEAYGPVPASPEVSLVVPLQRRVDLLEHQLVQFAADPELKDCELLYVLDDPEQRDPLHELAAELFRLYGQPFRVATLCASGGFPLACDLGASLSQAERLTFMAGDVLPDRPGWLGAMAAALDVDAGVAAVGPKLLYDDESIHHAGLEYVRIDAGGWQVAPRFRGLHRRVAAAERGGPVAALGISCLMIAADQFTGVGGFCAEYGEGAYEGSDLCRRLADNGRGCAYTPEAELYILEGLGAAPQARGERYARWLHARHWSHAMASTGREEG
jgi:GT2 family glycosyltransferase